jgi:CheY-like chemotaxis protein
MSSEAQHYLSSEEEIFGKAPLPLKGSQLLVVDSNHDTRELFTFAFEVNGATVTAVASAEEAIVAIDSLKPDVIISEIRLDDEDGYSLIRKVRGLKSKQSSSIPAIAVTTLASNLDRIEALAAGFQRCFTKPVDLDNLIAAIGRLIAPPSRLSPIECFKRAHFYPLERN